MYDLVELGLLENEINFPWAASIFDLIVIADIFENDEKEFLSYLNSRIPFYKQADFILDNEIDFLGLYLSRDFKKYLRAYKRGKKFLVDSKYRFRIDNYYKSIYENRIVIKPKKIVN